jgi:hypothetical protein
VITFAGISSARARLARLSDGLRQAAAGEVMARAVAKVGDQVRAVVIATLARHELTGAASVSTEIAVGATSVQIQGMPSRNAKNQQGRSYVSLYGWWPFRSGMPPFVVKRSTLIFARELLLALGAGAPPEAAALVGEADAAEAAKVERKRVAALTKPKRSRRG